MCNRAFHLSPSYMFLELIPCHEIWIIDQCHFPHKTAFSVHARGIIFGKCKWKSKNNLQSRFHIEGLKDWLSWEDSKYGLRIEFGLYLTPTSAKNSKKWMKSQFWSILMVFRPKYGLNIIQTQFWDRIWNPPVKANVFNAQYESGIGNVFIGYPYYFQNFISSVRTEKAVLWEKNGIVLVSTSHGTGLALKTWKSRVQWKIKHPKMCKKRWKSSYIHKGRCPAHLDLFLNRLLTNSPWIS